jgi:hypothetical protein
MTITDDRYPEVLLRCGAPHGDNPCEQALYVKLSLSDNAIYMCNRGHRIGQVSEVDEYLMATVLGALSRPKIRQKFVLAMTQVGSNLSVVPEQRRAFADWWDGASPRQRYDVMASAIERVLVAPESILDLDAALVMNVQWK